MLIYHLYPTMKEIGGAEKVLAALMKKFGGIVGTFDDHDQVHKSYKITNHLKITLLSLLKIKNTLIISHHRKLTTYAVIINKIFRRNNRVIHVAHNEFYNLKKFTFYPDEIIAVSNRVKDNLVNYFSICPSKIEVIHNGMPEMEYLEKKELGEKIKIIYAARINDTKQQIEVAQLFVSLNLNNIEIYFAGSGPNEEKLKEICTQAKNIFFLGMIDNVSKTFDSYTYMLLFSKNEGLPLSLIESIRSGTPVICNNVGGNTEIIDNTNGYIVNSLVELEELLIDLDQNGDHEYMKKVVSCRSTYESNFSEAEMLRKYKSYIEQNQ